MASNDQLGHLSPELKNILKKKQERHKGGAVVFKACGHGDFLKSAWLNDIEGERVRRHVALSVTGDCTIYDPWTEGGEDPRKEIIYTETGQTRDRLTGDRVKIEKPKYIDFSEGHLFVEARETVLLARMLFADQNRTWKYRDEKKKPLWEEVKVHADTIAAETVEIEVMSRAIEVVRTMDLPKLKEYFAAIFNVDPSGMKSNEIRHDLLVHVSKGGARQFMGCNIDPAIKAELKVREGELHKVLSYDEDGKTWKLSGKDIFTVSIGENPYTSLVAYLITPGAKGGEKDLKKIETLISEED